MANPYQTYTIDPGEDLARFRALYAPGAVAQAMAEAIRKGLDRANLIAVSRIKRSRFTGVGPFDVSLQKLGHRSRRLIRSLDASRAVVHDADTLRVGTGIGSNVKYYGPHEFGFEGSVQVPAHTREMPETARVSSSGRRYRVAAHTQSVKAHSRRMKIPARRPLRAGLGETENMEAYKAELFTALKEALQSP